MLADPAAVADAAALRAVGGDLGAELVGADVAVADGRRAHDAQRLAAASIRCSPDAAVDSRRARTQWQDRAHGDDGGGEGRAEPRSTVTKPCCRKAEVSAMLRFAGGLHIVGGRIVVEAELDTGAAARRLRRDIAEVYGHASEVAVVAPGGLRKGSRYVVRVVKDGEALARQTGLLDGRGRPVRGLPPQVVSGSTVRRRGRLARRVPGPRLADRARPVLRARDHLPGPGGGAGPGRRGPAARASRPRPARCAASTGSSIRDGDAIGALLTRLGAHDSVLAWEERRMRREVRATANRLANFDDANLRRSARAAVAAGARVERALEILGDDVPDHLAAAGRLRLEHKQASLEELGALADPPMTKDAIAGRIRRLLAMADKRAERPRHPGHRGRPHPGDAAAPEPGRRYASVRRTVAVRHLGPR